MYIQTPTSKPHGYHKPKIYNRCNSNTTLKIVIKPQENKREEKRPRDKGPEKINKNKSKTFNKRAIRTYISIITLNVNGLNVPTKRHRLAERIQKQNPYICCLQETHFSSRDTYKLKMK